MDWSSIIAGVAGGVTGGLVGHWAGHRQQRTARANAIEDQRIELYADWMTAMKRQVYSNVGENKPTDSLRNKLMLLERDSKLRELIEQVYGSMPDPLTPEGQEHYYMIGQDPDLCWREFDRAMDKLVDAVRASLGR